MPNKLAPILLVEDSLEDFEAARRAFKKAALENPLEHVLSGEAALEYLSSNKPRPSLILLDLNMPGMKGHEVLSRIKQNQELKDIPVVILTSISNQQHIKTCYKLGANAYILKSPDFDVLTAAIKKLKEYWLDTVALPPIFDEEDGPEKTVFSILNRQDAAANLQQRDNEIQLSATEIERKAAHFAPQQAPAGSAKLTPPEIETLSWIAKGKNRWEVGVILGISEDAVKARLEKARQKLGASNTTHAIAIALRQDLLGI